MGLGRKAHRLNSPRGRWWACPTHHLPLRELNLTNVRCVPSPYFTPRSSDSEDFAGLTTFHCKNQMVAIDSQFWLCYCQVVTKLSILATSREASLRVWPSRESIGSDAFLFPDTDKLAYFGKVVKPIRKTLQKIDNLIGKIVEIIASKNHFSTKKYLMWKTWRSLC